MADRNQQNATLTLTLNVAITGSGENWLYPSLKSGVVFRLLLIPRHRFMWPKSVTELFRQALKSL